MNKNVIVVVICALLVSCDEQKQQSAVEKYKCTDERATYFDLDGRVVKTEDGISEGYVLIPDVGDAGSFMLGTYVRIKNGKLVERYKRRPEVIEENTFKPWREKEQQKK